MEKDIRLRRYTLLVATTAAFLTPFMGSAINLAIPAIGREFNCSAFVLSWVATSYILASAAFLLPFGRLADIVGRKKVFVSGIVFFCLASLLCSLARSIEALIAFRVLQGIGSAMIFGTGVAILTSVFLPQERGKVLGINVATVYAGLSLGPVLGGAMNHNLGWQSIFYFTALIAALVAFLTLSRLKGEWVGARGEQYDFAGAFLYATGFSAFMYGISSLTASVWSKYIFIFGAALLAVFVWNEIRVPQPILDLKLFTCNVTFAFSNLAALINYSATFALGFLLSVHLQEVMGYDSQAAGFILLSQPVIMAALSPFTGRLSDLVEPRVLATSGMVLTTLGLFLFSFLTAATPLWLVIANLFIMGVGFALFSSPNSNAVMGSVEKRFYGVASSTLGTMRLTGQAISMAVVTLILALYAGNIQLGEVPAELLTKGSRTAFAVFAVICFGGIFASLARGNVREKAGR